MPYPASQASGLALPGSDLDVVVLGVVQDMDKPAEGFDGHSKVGAVGCEGGQGG